MNVEEAGQNAGSNGVIVRLVATKTGSVHKGRGREALAAPVPDAKRAGPEASVPEGLVTMTGARSGASQRRRRCNST